MKKTIFFVAIALTIGSSFFFNINQTNAVKPADHHLKEGDLISAIFSDDPDVYIVNENGFKRLFLNPEIFQFYGHLGGFFNIKLVTPEVRDSFITSGLFRNCEDNDKKVYGVDIEGEDIGQLHWVNSSGEQAIQDDPDFFKKVFCINGKEFNWYPKGNAFGTVKDVPKYDRMNEKATVATTDKIKTDAPLKEEGKAVICHYPSGNTSNPQTLTVSASALRAHFDHGDFVGACSDTPNAPSDLRATVSGNQVTLNWNDNSHNESEFKISRRLLDGAWAFIKILAANIVSYVDSRLSNGTYEYDVRACNSSGCSGDSNSVLAIIGTPIPTPTPTTTPIPNPSLTPTPTIIVTPVPTISSTPTPTVTPTPTPTTTSTPTPTPTPTTTVTPTPTTAYIITASAGVGGTISPSGQVSVNAGGSQTFIITANTGYQNFNKKVDGNSVGGQIGTTDSYTFTNVNANHTIEALFFQGNDSTLGDLTINGSTITGFHPNTYNYTVALSAGTTVIPTVGARTNDSTATKQITQATSFPGSATVLVTAQDGITTTLNTINFTLPTPTPTPTPSEWFDSLYLRDGSSENLVAKFDHTVEATSVNAYSGYLAVEISNYGWDNSQEAYDGFYYFINNQAVNWIPTKKDKAHHFNFGNCSYYEGGPLCGTYIGNNYPETEKHFHIVYAEGIGPCTSGNIACIPSYNSSHIYRYVLEITGAPTILNWGFGDAGGLLTQNSGQYDIKITPVIKK